MKISNQPISAFYFKRPFIFGALATSSFLFAQNKKDTIRTAELESVVLVGYGKQKKTKVSGAISEANLDKLTSRSLTNVGEALQGKTPGVTVLSEGGDPTGSPRVNIRGIGGINGESPLYVIDGVVVGSIAPDINPNDIESISVLKDASAAIYGARASGGVVLISTKKGRNNTKLRANFDAKYGFQNAWKLRHSLNAADYQDVIYKSYENAGKLDKLPEAFNPTKYPDGRITRTDWVDEIFRTGSIQEYNLNLNGGSESSNYYMGFNYRENEAILINTQAKRYNFRLNSDHRIKDWLRIGENAYYNFKDGNTANTSSGYTGAILSAMYYPSHIPVRDANGNYSGLPIAVSGGYGDVINPVAELERIDYKNPTHEILINPYIEVDLLEGLSFKTNFSQTFTLSDAKEFIPRRPEIGKPNLENKLLQNSTNYSSMLAEQILTYEKKFDAHSLDVMAAYTFQKDITEWNSSEGTNFPNEDPSQRFMHNATTGKKVDGGRYKAALMSYVARLNYDYAGKYVISVLGRRDGSSLVSEQNRFENYYSVSGAWVLSKENFFRNNVVNNFKIRASYGLLGNLGGISREAVNPLLKKFDYTIFGLDAAAHTALYPTVYPNNDLKWGKSEQTNIGFDAALLRNRLSIQFDYFVKNSKDQIFEKELPITSNGYRTTFVNGGLFQDRGIEVGLNYNSRKYGDFDYSLNANFGTLKSEVKEMPNDELIITSNRVRGTLAPTRNRIGDAPYSFYGFKTGGLFQSQEEINNYKDSAGNLLQPKAKPGDIKFLRKDGNTGGLSTDDYVNLGNPYPKFTYGFSINMNYKNFDFNAFLQGVHGNKIFNGLRYITLNPGGVGQNYNMDQMILNAWTPENRETDIPRLVNGDPNGNYNKPSDFYVEDGSYMRLKNLTLGYTIPEISDRLGFNKVRIYVTANNLFTITDYTGFDPEVGMDNYGVDVGRYPQSRTFLFGINLGF